MWTTRRRRGDDIVSGKMKTCWKIEKIHLLFISDGVDGDDDDDDVDDVDDEKTLPTLDFLLSKKTLSFIFLECHYA